MGDVHWYCRRAGYVWPESQMHDVRAPPLGRQNSNTGEHDAFTPAHASSWFGVAQEPQRPVVKAAMLATATLTPARASKGHCVTQEPERPLVRKYLVQCGGVFGFLPEAT